MSLAEAQMWVALALVGVLLVLYAAEVFSLELSSLLVICLLLVLLHFFPVLDQYGRERLGADDVLNGLANPALLTILAFLVAGEGLSRTGAMDWLASMMTGISKAPMTGLMVILFVQGILSAFFNNTPQVGMLIPVLQIYALSAGIGVGQVMMPLSFAVILGGTLTLIGTSTNLLVSSVLVQQGLAPLGFFEMTAFAIPLYLIGFAYIAFVMPRLLPRRVQAMAKAEPDERRYTSRVVLPADSSLIGKRVGGWRLSGLPDLDVAMVLRGEYSRFGPNEPVTLKAGDKLVLSGTRKALEAAAAANPGLFHPRQEGSDDRAEDRVRAVEESVKAEAKPEARDGADDTDSPHDASDLVLVEGMVGPTSRILGQSIAQSGFVERLGCVVLGIERRSHMLSGQLPYMRLDVGDVLLIQGPWEAIERLRADDELVILSGSVSALPPRNKALPTAVVFLAAVALGVFEIVPILVAAVLAATGMLALGSLTMRQAGRALDRRVILVAVASLAVGDALEATGGATYIADVIMAPLRDYGAQVMLSALFLVVAIFTNLISNNACAVLFTPIAISLAGALGVDPRVFVLTVLFAANCSFCTPVGYQTNLLVMGPGHYSYRDFIKAGTPLAIIIWIAFTLLSPLFFDLEGIAPPR